MSFKQSLQNKVTKKYYVHEFSGEQQNCYWIEIQVTDNTLHLFSIISIKYLVIVKY